MSLEQRIKDFNKDRQQPTIKRKYKLMADNEFTFFRATCHLFYEDLGIKFNQGPLVWACGDLHLENFGSYRAANGLTYFDINDFDEAMLAPAAWEVGRFLCSIGMASDIWNYSMKEAEKLMTVVLRAYTQQLAEGKAYAIEKETSPQLIRDFFELAEQRKEKVLIKSRIEEKKEKLKIIKDKTLPVEKEVRHKIKSGVNDFLKDYYPFIKVKDVAFRIAGTGSLGVKRFVLLVEDAKSNKWRLLDIKQAMASSLKPYLKSQQPHWKSESERITTVQNFMQYALPRFMGTLTIENDDYVLKQLQPSAQKIDHTLCHRKMKNVETVMETMARAMAASQIRSAARRGSADVETMMKFSLDSLWQANLIQAAIEYVPIMRKYYKEYKSLYKKDSFS
ncbi:MAG: DUF2252 family protein [Cyclobacteriaceae bacterium]